MKTKNSTIVLSVIAFLSLGSIFCSVTSQPNDSVAATMESLKATQTTLAQSFTQMAQLEQGIPTDTPPPVHINSPATPTATNHFNKLPGDITCPVDKESPPNTVSLEGGNYYIAGQPEKYPFFSLLLISDLPRLTLASCCVLMMAGIPGD
jgi:hypothetical protein